MLLTADAGWRLECLGMPQLFHGEESRLSDWRTIIRPYADFFNDDLVVQMPAVEVAADETRNDDPIPSQIRTSAALYYMLVLLRRDESLNIVVNVGVCEGLLARRRLILRCDSAAATRLAGGMMSRNFAEDNQWSLELFERELLRYEQREGEQGLASLANRHCHEWLGEKVLLRTISCSTRRSI